MTPPDSSTARSSARASAPGSLMVLGEHAVLHGHLAIVCAINLRLSVHATRRTDGRVLVASALGERATTLRELDCSPPFHFVLNTLATFADALPGGVELEIESEFRDDLGLGSSAAVTVAAHAALDALIGRELPHQELQACCRDVIRQVQGLGSGADAAASILGGVVAYRAAPLEFQRVCEGLPLVVAYSGSKEKTSVVVRKVEQLRTAFPDVVASIYQSMDAVARDALPALMAQDWSRLGQLLNMGQVLMDALGVSTPKLNTMLDQMRAAPGIHGAKISGSGLGDCIIGLGSAGDGSLPFSLLPVTSSNRGVEVA